MFEYVQEREFSARLEPRTMIYVITIGETEEIGSTKLTEKGRNQVLELAHSRLVAGIRIMYSDPSNAAIQTSEILRREFECKMEKRSCLSEINWGFKWDDIEQLKENLPKMWSDENESVNRGESLAEARERIGICMNEIAVKHVGDSLAVVMHPLITTLFHSLVTAAPLEFKDWLMMGYAACASYEYTKKGWTLVMPPDNSFQSDPSCTGDILPEDIFE
ncbi:MAG: histidine phosphatase family protein [Candidatus Thorarchaeota archaeon]|nr:histidine phosphatase family protein [Candidatus Thorarchaeota archaeon]